MRIRVELSPSGVKKAQDELRQCQETLEQRLRTFSRRLAEEGLQVARIRFQNAQYAGDNDVTVTVEESGNAVRLLARGQSVAFIEFGTGVAYPEHPSGLFAHGTYGQGKGANEKGWVYKGKPGTGSTPVGGKSDVFRTKGNPPAMAMWEARLQMIAKVEQVWREVMSN